MDIELELKFSFEIRGRIWKGVRLPLRKDQKHFMEHLALGLGSGLGLGLGLF